jgi:hypothetical protein
VCELVRVRSAGIAQLTRLEPKLLGANGVHLRKARIPTTGLNPRLVARTRPAQRILGRTFDSNVCGNI